MEQYTVKKGTIISSNGLPCAPRWFCDGRVAMEIDNECISQIDYFSPKTNGSYIVFRKRFWKGICFYLDNTKLRPENTEILPFGFKSTGESADYSVYIANEKIIINIVPKFNANELRTEFYDDFIFYPETHEHHDIRYGGTPRTWSNFAEEENIIKAKYTENGVDNFVSFSSNSKLLYSKRKGNGKNIISVLNAKQDEPITILISFSPEEYKTYSDCSKILEEQFKRYNKVAENAPVLKSNHKYLNQFFQLAPMYHESLKVNDVPGAIRAQTTHYWVWGWDSMTCNESSVYWGDSELVGNMLECMEKYADEKGVAHAFDRSMKNCDPAPPSAQGMYITLLDLYRICGGDYKKHYEFAKQIFKLILNTEVRKTGLCKGTSLVPDFRELVHETGNDISSFNNTVGYCAVRSMQALAKDMNDTETETLAKDMADRTEQNFQKILFNEKYGIFDLSVEADTYEQRNVPSGYCVKWENGYCYDLIKGKEAQCAEFYKNNLVCNVGIRPVPTWSDCWDIDSNQLHCWWSVHSEFYTRLLNLQNKPEELNQYAGWVEYWSKKLMCPEGISCYDDSYEVEYDNWNAQCGIWQGYSIRGMYNAIVHNFIGVDFNRYGINFYAYSGEELEIENLHFGNRSFNIKMSGSGKQIEKVILNGEDIGSVSSIKFEQLKNKNSIEVIRK